MTLEDFRLAVVPGVALVVGLVPLLAWAPSAEGAGSLPNGFGQGRFAGGLNGPTAMAFAPDGRHFATDYFFVDFCSGWIRRYDTARDRTFAFKGASNERPVDLKVGANGDLYYLTRAGDGPGPSTTGAVKRIWYGS